METKRVLVWGGVFVLLAVFAVGAYMISRDSQEGNGNKINGGDKVINGKNGDENGEPKDDDVIESDLIKVSFPRPNDGVGSPLIVTGIARGGWYFEADFPVTLEDESGNRIASGIAQAQGEWMTEKFVPFEAELNFNVGNLERGNLILYKDNPSGLENLDDFIRIPVRFDSGKMTVRAYFSNSHLGDVDCDDVVPTGRSIDRSAIVGRVALAELFKGVSEEEEILGYKTSINEGVEIQRLIIEGGVAKVDLNEELDRGVAGSCRVIAIRAQTEKTLKQFPTVDLVEISIDGRVEGILQP